MPAYKGDYELEDSNGNVRWIQKDEFGEQEYVNVETRKVDSSGDLINVDVKLLSFGDYSSGWKTLTTNESFIFNDDDAARNGAYYTINLQQSNSRMSRGYHIGRWYISR